MHNIWWTISVDFHERQTKKKLKWEFMSYLWHNVFNQGLGWHFGAVQLVSLKQRCSTFKRVHKVVHWNQLKLIYIIKMIVLENLCNGWHDLNSVKIEIHTVELKSNFEEKIFRFFFGNFNIKLSFFDQNIITFQEKGITSFTKNVLVDSFF